MSRLPLVSVIVPVHNAEETIGRTINSILNQDYGGNIELIIIDDGSSDHTVEKCQAYKKKNLIVFSQKNSGVSSARNVGIQKARGDYLFFCDADDIMEKNMVSKMVNIAKSHPNSLIICDMIFNNTVKKMSKVGLFKINNKIEVIKMVLNSTDLYSPCNKVYNATLAKKISFPIGVSYGEDLIFNLRYISYVNSIFFVPKPLYKYIFSKNGHSSRSASVWQNRAVMMQELKGYLGKKTSFQCSFILALIKCRWGASVIKSKIKGVFHGISR